MATLCLCVTIFIQIRFILTKFLPPSSRGKSKDCSLVYVFFFLASISSKPQESDWRVQKVGPRCFVWQIGTLYFSDGIINNAHWKMMLASDLFAVNIYLNFHKSFLGNCSRWIINWIANLKDMFRFWIDVLIEIGKFHGREYLPDVFLFAFLLWNGDAHHWTLVWENN